MGNLFEHYDAALFGFLSPFLAPLIFPSQEPITALILTYAMIPLGMFARPFGALFFGYIGDRNGRGFALFLTFLGMGIVSFIIALTPTYVQGGIIAPIFFCMGRILQNFFASGESMGGAIYLLENSEEKKHDLLSGIYGSSTIGGILLASFAVFCLSLFDAVSSGWRILYLFGCLTAFFGCLIRWESKEKEHLNTKQVLFRESMVNWGKQLFLNRKYLLAIMIVAGFGYANYSISLVLMNGLIPLVSPFSKSEMLSLNTFLLILDFCALPFFGFLSSKISREKMMLLSAFCVVIGAIPACMLLNNGALFTIVCVRICFVLTGVAFFAPFHSWAQQLVPIKSRYAIISFGYALGSQLFGGPTASFALWCFKKTGMVASVAWYWMFLAFLSIVAISLTSAKKALSLGRAKI